MNTSGANTSEQAERGHRVLYVLSASLALAVIAMIAVAIKTLNFMKLSFLCFGWQQLPGQKRPFRAHGMAKM